MWGVFWLTREAEIEDWPMKQCYCGLLYFLLLFHSISFDFILRFCCFVAASRWNLLHHIFQLTCAMESFRVLIKFKWFMIGIRLTTKMTTRSSASLCGYVSRDTKPCWPGKKVRARVSTGTSMRARRTKTTPNPRWTQSVAKKQKICRFFGHWRFFLGQPMQLAVARGMRRLVARVKY